MHKKRNTFTQQMSSIHLDSLLKMRGPLESKKVYNNNFHKRSLVLPPPNKASRGDT